jgi:signal transduction histidine kinase
MPALAKPQAHLPHFVPHGNTQANLGTGVSDFSQFKPRGESRVERGVTQPNLAVLKPNSSEGPEDLDKLAHDARNILSALMLYGELLATPGVLTRKHIHRAQELQVITGSAAQIIERMARAKSADLISAEQPLPATSAVPPTVISVTDVAEELGRLQPLLAAIVGPAVKLSVAALPCPGRTALAVEDLTRILVNLVRNASDAMPSGGHIRITAQYGDGLSFLESDYAIGFGPPRSVLLTVADNGPGIPKKVSGRIFDLGFTTRKQSSDWPTPRRGLGLSIVRNLVEAAGGTVQATSAPGQGARFELTLPLFESVTSGTSAIASDGVFPADGPAKGCIECH